MDNPAIRNQHKLQHNYDGNYETRENHEDKNAN